MQSRHPRTRLEGKRKKEGKNLQNKQKVMKKGRKKMKIHQNVLSLITLSHCHLHKHSPWSKSHSDNADKHNNMFNSYILSMFLFPWVSSEGINTGKRVNEKEFWSFVDQSLTVFSKHAIKKIKWMGERKNDDSSIYWWEEFNHWKYFRW